jgi:uncharacterized protein (UPF0335 family)
MFESSTEVQPELPQGVSSKLIEDAMKGSLKIAHLEEEYFDIEQDMKDFFDVSIEGQDSKVVIQSLI